MTKTNKNYIYAPLVTTGYILFGILVIFTFISTTIPFGSSLLNPQSIKLNVTVAMLAFTIGAILPVVVGYVIGDRSVRSKSKLSHHFNGMLFGLLAYWMMTLFAVFIPINQLSTDQNVRLILANLLPSLVVAVVGTALAIGHIRSTVKSRDLLEYKPFVLLLVVAIIAEPVLSIANNVTTNSINTYSFIPLGIVLLIGFASYSSLAKVRLTSIIRVAWVAVAISVSFVVIYMSNLLESTLSGYLIPYPTMESQTVGSAIAMIVALIGWSVYWAKQTKGLRGAKK